jgi:hypothetical protein
MSLTGTVRMQWDPDHLPNGDAHPYRRAVQLGLKGVPTFADGTDIVDIQDVSEFVHKQAQLAKLEGKSAKPKKGNAKTTANEEASENELLVARERVFVPTSAVARRMIEMAPPPDEARSREDDD